jgi:hypothetical protein
MAEVEKDEFQFPDEIPVDTSSKGKPEEEKLEIEVIDDTPPEDQGRKPMKEPPAEVTDDELAQYSEGVKKRIQHFSKGYHEERRKAEAAQREREEAIRLAKTLAEENRKLQANLEKGQQALLEQAKKNIAAEVDEAKRLYKQAYEAGYSDKLVEAQAALTKAELRAEKVANYKPTALQPQENEVQPETVSTDKEQTPVNLDAKARAWYDSNPWFGTNRKMTALALAVHQELVDEGVDPTSDDYYDRINSEVKQAFPSAFPSGKPAKKSSVVAPATRSTAPRKIVLTQSQVSIAKRLGVPLELYAKQVAEQMRNQNG